MSFITDVDINGVSLYSDYGFHLNAIDGLTPLQPAQQSREIMPGALTGVRGRAHVMDKTITLKGTCHHSGGNYMLHYVIERLAGLVGWYGNRYREVILRVYYFNNAGAHPAGRKEAIYTAIIDDMRLDYRQPNSITNTAEVSLTFLITGVLHPDGLIARDYSLSGGYTNVVFEDTDALHGANRVSHIIREAAGTNTSDIELYCHAIAEGFVDDHLTGTAVGLIPWREGAFGTPAAYFDGGGAYYLRYAYVYAIPIAGTSDITVFMRFKRQYTIGDNLWHTLLGDSNPSATGFKIMVMNNAYSEILATDGSKYASVVGNTVSDTDWNTIIARFSATAIKLRLITPGGTYQDTASGGSSSFPASGLYLYVGTGASGIYRANAIIDEVAIWKHYLSDDAETALYNPVVELPMRQRSEYDLNKRLVFLQDWTRGLNALANRGAMIASSTTLNNEDLIIDTDRQTLKVLAHSNMSLTDVASTLGTGIFGIVPNFPLIERYNRFTVSYSGASAGLSLESHYMPLERL